jgi:hypothetical protein
MSDADLIHLLLWVIGGSSTLVAAVCAFAARTFIKRIDVMEHALTERMGEMERSMRDEMRIFDRRMTRVETKLGLEFEGFIKRVEGESH